ncbi:NAD(P)-binding protein [Nemania sp. FL0031]|nr:NAD(P)-binding protein [Nemania sp. FL0031]
MLRVTLFGSKNSATNGTSFEPERDIRSLAGKVILITGGSGGLGRQTVTELARYGRPAHIYIADMAIDQSAKATLIDQITKDAYDGKDDGSSRPTTIHFLDLDLTSFASVRACAAEFLSQEKRLDILMLNAGVIRVPPMLTSQGYELHFGLNYLGHALLTRLLLPALQRTAQSDDSDVRIVVISSEGHAITPKGGIQYGSVKSNCSEMSYAQRYGQSKLALIGLMRELSSRCPEIKTAAVHPGRILTGMADSLRKESLFARITTPIAPLICVPVTIGIRNHLWVATSPEMVSGTYYEPVGVPGKTSKEAEDKDMPRRLWEWTSNELKDLDVLS